MTLVTGPLARRRFLAVWPVRATSMHFLLATVRATGGSVGHWPDAVGGCLQSLCKQQSPVYCWVSVTMGVQCAALFGFVFDDATHCTGTAQSIMWLPDTGTQLQCIAISSAVLCIQQSPSIALVAAFCFQRVSVCKSQYTMPLCDCI